MRALVTGCAGFIGSHLTEYLLDRGVDVIGVDCFNDNYGRRQKLTNLERALDWSGFEFVPIDLAQGELEEYVEQVDVVLHLAAEPGVRSSWGTRFDRYLQNNVRATQHLLEAARRWPEKRLIFASSSSIYGQAEGFPTREDAVPAPFSPYGVTKLCGENLCVLYEKNFGVDAVSLRYFSVYGPRQRPDMAFNIFCRAALDNTEVTVFGDGSQTRDFTYVGDVVEATWLAATAQDVGGACINIGGGDQVALRDAIDEIEALAGRPLTRREADREHGDVRDTCAATDLAVELLGFTPSTSWRAGLAREFEWVRELTEATAVG